MNKKKIVSDLDLEFALDEHHIHADPHALHEPDLAYWLEHVVHWHALLLAVILVLTVGYIFFNQTAAFASQ